MGFTINDVKSATWSAVSVTDVLDTACVAPFTSKPNSWRSARVAVTVTGNSATSPSTSVPPGTGDTTFTEGTRSLTAPAVIRPFGPIGNGFPLKSAKHPPSAKTSALPKYVPADAA